MATVVLTRGKTLPDSGVKSDLHDLIDLTTGSVSDITNSDIATGAAIAGTKISPNFGSQDVVCSDVTASGDATIGGTLDVTGALTAGSGIAFTTGFSAYETTDASQVGGSTTALADDTQYQTATAGFVVGYYDMGGNGAAYFTALYGSSSASTTVQSGGATTGGDTGSTRHSFFFYVPESYYWKITTTGGGSTVIKFLPIS